MQNCHCKCGIDYIYPCTTPTITYHVDFPLYIMGDDGEAKITFAQRGIKIFSKSGQDVAVDLDRNVILVQLTNEETNKLKIGLDLQMQIWIKFEDEREVVSNEMRVPVARLLGAEVEER